MFTNWKKRRAIQKRAGETDEEWAKSESYRLLNEASRLGIELPDMDSLWLYELSSGDKKPSRTHLSPFGRAKVAKLIREEKIKNIEQLIKLIAPIITALTGLLGAIIGLVAILQKK